MTFTMHVVCPMCNERLHITTEAVETWGRLSPTDLGIAEVTILDAEGVVNKHRIKHAEENPDAWVNAYEGELSRRREHADQYFHRKESPL